MMLKRWARSILLLFIVVPNLFSENKVDFNYDTYRVEPGVYIDINDKENIFHLSSRTGNWIMPDLSGHYNFYNKDGIEYLQIVDKDQISYEFGFLQSEDKIILKKTHSEIVIFASCVQDKSKGYSNNFGLFYGFESSSYFSEEYGGKSYNYIPDNLSNWSFDIPWVEGSENEGIGDWISFRKSIPKTRSLYIVNGFYDPDRTYLYSQNNRLREFRLSAYSDEDYKSLLYENVFLLEDEAILHKIELPDDYQYFKIEIVSVYSGTKFNDTCITAIYTDKRSGY